MAFRQAIKLNPKLPQGYYHIGAMLASQGKLDGAADELRKAVTGSPAYIDAHLALAEVYLRQNHLDKARVEFAVAAKLDPRNFEAQLGAAQVAHKTGDIDGAYNICKEMLNTFGDRAELHLLWGRLLAQKGRTRDAVDAWQKALSFAHDDALKQQATKAIDAALQWEEVAGT